MPKNFMTLRPDDTTKQQIDDMARMMHCTKTEVVEVAIGRLWHQWGAKALPEYDRLVETLKAARLTKESTK